MTTSTKKVRKMESDVMTLEEIQQATADDLAAEERTRQAERDAAISVLQEMLPALASNRGVDKARLQSALEAVGWQMPELLEWVAKFQQLQQHQAMLDKHDRAELGAELRKWNQEFEQAKRDHQARYAKRRGLLAMLGAEAAAVAKLTAELQSIGLLHNPAIGVERKTISGMEFFEPREPLAKMDKHYDRA